MNDLARLRVLKLLLGGRVDGPSYSASFEAADDAWRPLSIIAGESQTGKTSIAEFVLYCLGARTFPEHPEIAQSVRSAMVELILAGEPVSIERAATVEPSSRANLREAGDLQPESLLIEPTSDPASLSQRLLRAFDLEGTALPQAPTQEASDVDTLSMRDLTRLIWLPNDRLDSKNLVFEHSNYNVARKFRQTVDAVFGVDDAQGAAVAANLKLARTHLREAEGVARSILGVVQAEHPEGPLGLESARSGFEASLVALRRQLEDADLDATNQGSAVSELTSQVDAARRLHHEASLRVRNRQSLLTRLLALRAQYVDDHKKLIFLSEADLLFDPLQVSTCPACLSELSTSPSVHDSHCTLCGQVVEPTEDREAVGQVTVQVELRALKRRLSELEAYIGRLQSDFESLKSDEARAADRLDSAVRALEAITELPAPFLALRDDLQGRVADLMVARRQTDSGLRLWQQVADADAKVDTLRARVDRLREERSSTSIRPDRAAMVSSLSRRFGEVMADLKYPKLSEPYLDDNLIPHVRGLPYTSASSGGQVLISLAWYLSLWELAYENDARAPGLLIVDSPQKNLGHRAQSGDADFGDFGLVEAFYAHAKQWLAGPGSGAQLIVIDNSPPDSVEDDIIVRFTRDPAVPPYGLITDAVD